MHRLRFHRLSLQPPKVDDKGKEVAHTDLHPNTEEGRVFETVMEVSEEGRSLETAMMQNRRKYNKTIREETIEEEGVEHDFFRKLSKHCVKRKEQISRLPGFWSKAFKAIPILGRELNATDSIIFDNHLNSIEVEYNADSKSGFSIIFEFTENEYFSNKRISKRYNMHDGDLTSIVSTSIDWKVEIPNIVPEENDEEDEDTFERKLTSYSFFNWFISSSDKEDFKNGDRIGKVIVEKLWVDPLHHLQGDSDDTDSEDEVEQMSKMKTMRNKRGG